MEEHIKHVLPVYELFEKFDVVINPVKPAPPLGQDMTQGQFLSGV